MQLVPTDPAGDRRPILALEHRDDRLHQAAPVVDLLCEVEAGFCKLQELGLFGHRDHRLTLGGDPSPAQGLLRSQKSSYGAWASRQDKGLAGSVDGLPSL